jgi:hypothetical protein
MIWVHGNCVAVIKDSSKGRHRWGGGGRDWMEGGFERGEKGGGGGRGWGVKQHTSATLLPYCLV